MVAEAPGRFKCLNRTLEVTSLICMTTSPLGPTVVNTIHSRPGPATATAPQNRNSPKASLTHKWPSEWSISIRSAATRLRTGKILTRTHASMITSLNSALLSRRFARLAGKWVIKGGIHLPQGLKREAGPSDRGTLQVRVIRTVVRADKAPQSN